MSETELNTVACPACRKRFVWKPDFAGKAVKCTCGKAFIIPALPENLPLRAAAAPASTVPLGAGDFEGPLVERPVAARNCPSCNLPMKPGAAVCLNCGFDVRRGGKVQTKVLDDDGPPPLPASIAAASATDFVAQSPDQTPAPTSARRSRVTEALVRRDDDQGETPFVDFYLPIIFLIAGVLLTVLHALQEDETIGRGFLRAGINLVLKVPLMLAAVTLTAHLMGISYGPLTTGLLKIAGIVMGPMALADVILASILSATLGFGIWLAAFFYIIIAGIPLSYMFDLEMGETLITLVVIVVLQVVFSVFLGTVILGMLV